MERRFALLVLRQPEVTGKVYALRVPVRYQNVQGMAFLETWNYFRSPDGSPQEQAFFSRTLAAVGPLAALNGTSNGWSDRVLFFMAEGRRPTRVELNLYMPGKGQVELGTAEWIANAEAWARQVGLVSSQPDLRLLAALVAAVAALLVAAAVFARRRRRAAELRRMLAEDSGR